MLRRWPLPLALVLLLAIPASAADQAVQATPSSTFEPANVEIDLGDTVTFSNAGGTHNVRWDDGSVVEQPADPDSGSWSFERTFDQPGVHRYFCELHGAEGGVGMSGRVTVRDASGQVPAPPGLSMTTKKTRSLESVLKRIVVKARCSGGCVVRFTVLDKGKAVGGKGVNLESGAAARKVEIKLRKKARKRLAKRTSAFRLTVEARAVNDAGDQTLRRKITVKP